MPGSIAWYLISPPPYSVSFAAFAGVAFFTAALRAGFGADFFAASARFTAHRLLFPARIRFMPSALIRRLGFGGSGVAAGAGGSDSLLILAYRRLLSLPHSASSGSGEFLAPAWGGFRCGGGGLSGATGEHRFEVADL